MALVSVRVESLIEVVEVVMEQVCRYSSGPRRHGYLEEWKSRVEVQKSSEASKATSIPESTVSSAAAPASSVAHQLRD